MHSGRACIFDFGYIGGNSFTTYSRVPFYFTSHTRALHIDSLERAIVHFTKVDTIEIEINSTELCGRIITGNRIKALDL